MSSLDERIRRVQEGPGGPQVGAFFDFDGTLIDGYSAAAWLADRVRRREAGIVEILDALKLVRQPAIDDVRFESALRKATLAWSGYSESEVRALWKRLWLARVAPTLFPEGWKLVHAHQRMGHTVAIASSATRYQVEPLADEYGVAHVLASPVKVLNGRLTGGLDGPPAWGAGKADAVLAFARAHGIELAESYGYANGDEDIEFLKAVGRPAAIQPKERLEQAARDSGWPILRFAPRRRPPPAAVARTVGAYAASGTVLLAGLAYARATGRRRAAVDFVTAAASDAALALLGVDLEVIGEKHLWAHRPCVFIVNHQSKFDLFAVLNLVRRGISGAAKAEARQVPGFGQYMELADFAFLDRANSRKAVEALAPAVDRLRSGLSVCISPEGTRSWTPRLGKFKKGPFYLAKQANVPVVPIVIRNAGEIMGRNDQTMRSGTVQVAVLAPVDVSTWAAEEMSVRIEEVRQRYIDTLDNWPEKSP